MAIIDIHIWRQHNFYRLSNVENTSVNSNLPNPFLLLNMICLFLSLIFLLLVNFVALNFKQIR